MANNYYRGEDPGYPLGATHDPNAPYNEPEVPEMTFNASVSYTISRTDVEVTTDEYTYDNGYAVMNDDAIDCNPVEAMKKAAEYLEKYKAIVEKDGKKDWDLYNLIYILKDWQVDEREVDADKIDIEPYEEEDQGSSWRDP